MVDFLTKHVIYQKSPLAGNSIYMDRRYLKKYMPKFDVGSPSLRGLPLIIRG